jgi:hypothetical protein
MRHPSALGEQALTSRAVVGARSPWRRHACALACIAALLVAVACAQPGPPRAVDGPPRWDAVAGTGTIEVVTIDPDGDVRETTIWLAVLDGEGYIRTGRSRWMANLERDPRLRLRIADPNEPDAPVSEHRMRVERITDADRIAAVAATFRAKYGISDRFVTLFPGLGIFTMRLEPDVAPAAAPAAGAR